MAASIAAPADASVRREPSFIPAGAASFPPLGFFDFCNRNPGECQAVPSQHAAPPAVALAAATASLPAPAPNNRLMAWGGDLMRTADPQEPINAISYGPAGRAYAPTNQPAALQAALQNAFVSDWRSRPVTARVVALMTPQAPLVAPAAPDEQAAQADDTMVEATPEFLKQIDRVNRRINGAMISRPDFLSGRGFDSWDLPLEAGSNVGDCEDFALEKRRMLISQGVSRRALTMAIVRTARGELHAVLVVRTSKGDMVMDSLSSWVSPWQKTGYRWVQRQSAEDPMKWNSIPA